MSNTNRDASLTSQQRRACAIVAAGDAVRADPDTALARRIGCALGCGAACAAGGPSAPTVTTLTLAPFGFGTQLAGTGDVTSDGGASLSAVGFVWNTSGAAPTFGDHVVSTVTAATGPFSLTWARHRS